MPPAAELSNRVLTKAAFWVRRQKCYAGLYRTCAAVLSLSGECFHVSSLVVSAAYLFTDCGSHQALCRPPVDG
jgi:hypothetical protein